ncbi:MAG: MBL fold metallo-hydrolase [Verrucomicrobia bacterium]|nr:MBL fold metallo-hydrolase [Verrucomicrobiota bacterium]MDA1066497.1 MBL fold metallo-hydrolase [Verrucomicrobiota bacterium]
MNTPKALLFLSFFFTTLGSLSADNLLKVYWVDVEGGAATLVITPAGESILIDTGNPGERDPGRINKLAREEAGISKIDHLVITHFDGDHFGGAADLSKLITIGTVYHQGVRPQDRERVGEAYLTFACDARLILTAGDELPLKQASSGPKLSAKALGIMQRNIPPNGLHKPNPLPTSGYARQDPDLSHNANSVILLFEYGDWQFLDAADLSWNLEEKLVSPYNLVGEVDVYQVDHHGLDRSNNTHFIHSIRPTVAVMNNAHSKGTGPVTVAGLRRSPGIEAIFQVHLCTRKGEEHLNTDEEKIANLKSGNDCEGNHLFLTVAMDGSSYSVTVPRTGHVGTYQTR